MGKIIVIDWSIFLHMSAYASVKCGMAAPYLAMTMIISNLRLIGVDSEDLIIVACDGRDNWRKEYIESVKGDRAEKKARDDVNWTQTYADFDRLLYYIDLATDWHIVMENKAEADDICAVCARYYSDQEVVLLSMDSDLEVLWNYHNVKIFSPHRKCKSYKIRPDSFDAGKWLAKAVQSKGHNNLGVPENEKEYKIKSLCINLLELPDYIEDSIRTKLDNLPIKGFELSKFPMKGIVPKIRELYLNDRNRISYSKCKEKKLKKKRRMTCQKRKNIKV